MKTKFKRLHFIALLGFMVFLADYAWEYYNFSKKYNQNPLTIKTFDGSNQPYHPSVIFRNEGWKGYRYWMAETPYPIGGVPYRDRWECPTIHVSNDGYNWSSPGKLQPIDDLTDEEINQKDYFSDPHLVLKDSVLECFYRLSQHTDEGVLTYLLRKKTKDGQNWGEREILMKFPSEKASNSLGDMVISPAILFENDGYKMWYVEAIYPYAKNKPICFSISSDGLEWSKHVRCILNGPPVNPWHVDVTHIGEEYQMTIYDIPDSKDLTLWVSKDGIHFTYLRKLLSPVGVGGPFYSEGLYRSSLIQDDKNLKLYFSAYDTQSTYLGLMEGASLEEIKTVSANGERVGVFKHPRTFLSIWKKKNKTGLCNLFIDALASNIDTYGIVFVDGCVIFQHPCWAIPIFVCRRHQTMVASYAGQPLVARNDWILDAK